MLKFKVEIIAEYWVTLEAEDEEDAEEKALDSFQANGPDSYSVENITEIH